jgi:antitoxin ParD1/3/4
MDNVTISLPPVLKQFVEEQVESGGYGSASEYIGRLVREDHERKRRTEVDGKLLEALDGGPALPWTADDLESLKLRLRERYPDSGEET